jgi:hypothetical protein
MHESIQTTDRIYGLFVKGDMKEQLHNLGNSEEINLLEEISPEDRDFLVDIVFTKKITVSFHPRKQKFRNLFNQRNSLTRQDQLSYSSILIIFGYLLSMVF